MIDKTKKRIVLMRFFHVEFADDCLPVIGIEKSKEFADTENVIE